MSHLEHHTWNTTPCGKRPAEDLAGFASYINFGLPIEAIVPSIKSTPCKAVHDPVITAPLELESIAADLLSNKPFNVSAYNCSLQ